MEQYAHDIFSELELDVTEKPVFINLVAQLRKKAEDLEGKKSQSQIDLLYEAADEIERLQAIVRSNKPVTLLKEIWKHQPVYLFEAIADHQSQEEVHSNESYL